MMMKYTLRAPVIVIFGGALFAWYTVIQDFIRFFDIEGTVFRIKDCAFPNPVTTPCFWGAVAFVVALLASIAIMRNNALTAQYRGYKKLVLFLFAGNVFAWSNAIYGIVDFYKHKDAGPVIGCSGLLVANPFMTPCFWGSVLFLLSLVASIVTLNVLGRALKKYTAPAV